MKLIVDEINKQTCPFYASKDWENDLKIEYEKGGCILDTSPCSEDKYWEYDKIEKNYKLHFRRFYEDEIIATILQDEDDGTFCVFYALENVYESDFDSLDAETIEEAKAEVEERIVDLTQEQIECLQSWVDMFTSIKAVNYE